MSPLPQAGQNKVPSQLHVGERAAVRRGIGDQIIFVNALAAEVEAATKQFTTGLLPVLKKLPAQIGYDCRHCEYRLEDAAEKSGFAEFWGPLAIVFNVFCPDVTTGREHVTVRLDFFELRLAVCSAFTMTRRSLSQVAAA